MIKILALIILNPDINRTAIRWLFQDLMKYYYCDDNTRITGDNAMEINNKHCSFSHQLRGNVADIIQPSHDEQYMVRWLRGRSSSHSENYHCIQPIMLCSVMQGEPNKNVYKVL